MTNDAIRFLEDKDVTTVEKHNILTSDRNVLEITFCVLMEIKKRAVFEWYKRMEYNAGIVDLMTSKEIHHQSESVPLNLFVESAVSELKEYLRSL